MRLSGTALGISIREANAYFNRIQTYHAFAVRPLRACSGIETSPGRTMPREGDDRIPHAGGDSVNGAGAAVLVHLASGIGNIVMATPLLMALADAGFSVDVRLDADYAQTIELFHGWSVIRRIAAAAFPAAPATYGHVLAAVPPFYWFRFAGLYRGRTAAPRPPDSLFQADEQAWYIAFARALGCGGETREYRLPVGPSERFGVSGATVVLAPGCKT